MAKNKWYVHNILNEVQPLYDVTLSLDLQLWKGLNHYWPILKTKISISTLKWSQNFSYKFSFSKNTF
jgi:hypothetical protein